MTSRNVYAALTPDHADFSQQPRDRPSSPFLETFHENEDVQTSNPSRLCTALGNAKSVVKANTGLLLIVASQAFLSLMNVAVKVLNGIDPPVSPFELVVVRMGITYICCISYMLLAGVPDPWLGPKGVRLLLVFRGFTGFFGLFGVYYSLQYLSLSDATVLTFLAPLCTAYAGALFLKETFTKRQLFAGVFSLIGVVLIARPDFLFGSKSHAGDGERLGGKEVTSAQRLAAVGVALLGVLGATGAYTSLRAIGKRAHPLHSMMYFSMYCVIIASIGLVSTGTPFVIPTRIEWVALLFMIGIFGFSAQTLLTMGLQRETAGRGSMAIYTQIVFASILERIFFHTVPSALSVLGTCMIIASALYVVLTKESAAEEKKTNAVSLREMNDVALEEGLLEEGDMKEDEHERESVEVKEKVHNEEERRGDAGGSRM
ncbi:hypothetical protein BDQ17DRAFT_1240680 [Cyathus striatus]|nr:hypothetical protein BDQ17DRAFT_1240680 [Cyathus striatus]